MTSQAVFRIRVPAPVREPRGAIFAAALMLALLRGIASVTAAMAARVSGSTASPKGARRH